MTRLADGSSDSIEDVSGPDYAKKFAKTMLKTQVFTGSFVEKRFVESLNAYRDVITIDDDETEFIQNLVVVKKKIESNFVQKPWIGVTMPETIGVPVGYNLWVTLPQEIFGKYWFKVKTVDFLENEVRLRLEILRPLKKERTPTKADADDSINFDFSEVSDSFKTNLIYFWRYVLTIQNIKQSVIFIFILLWTVLLTTVDVIKYLMEYLLKFIREFSGFVKAATPLLTVVINCFGKIIYGFYAMVVALWHGKQKVAPPVVQNYYVDPSRALTFRDPQERYNKYYERGLPYPRSGVTITEL